MQFIILVRHAECYKNIKDEHGGKGDTLTENGKKQLLPLCNKIKSIVTQHEISVDKLFYSDVVQTKETAEYLSERLKIPSTANKKIFPLNLGYIAGLSRSDAAIKFPDGASQLEKWRENKLDIRDLHLPGAEDIETFWCRGKSFIDEVTKNGESVIVVGSRSILILLINILLGNNPYVNGVYYPFDFSYASITQFINNKNKWELVYSTGVRTVDGKSL